MEITILVENQTGRIQNELCASEWGLSAVISINGVNILFDTGHSDIYWQNAQKLGIDLNDVDFIALSHHHWDHTEGLLSHIFKDKKKIILHPDILNNASKDVIDIIKKDFEVIPSNGVLEFSPSIYFLGEIPRKFDYEKGTYKNKMLDDTALAIKSKNGVIVLTGCSHSGISNICEYAKKVTGQKLFAVIGGFHLFEDEGSVVEETIKYFKNEKPDYLYPMHCVDFPVLVKLHNEFNIKKLGAGDTIEFEE
jgi:7,8-dihydropterin-6-yl-methyl-4-(beta-D-ribofuranosyl)aminobenzene 5'-phosphate synthase